MEIRAVWPLQKEKVALVRVGQNYISAGDSGWKQFVLARSGIIGAKLRQGSLFAQFSRARSSTSLGETMFTGIITDIGHVLETEQRGDLRARIGTSYDIKGIDIGASIACDGVCLTVIALGDSPQNWFDVEISAESVSATNIGKNHWPVNKRLNLERALKVGDELGGHIVSGHVDGVAEVVALEDEGDSTRVTFRAPDDLARFIAPKGSVSLNGTSLTVNAVNGADFGVNFIPHTKVATTWGDVKVGDFINLEIDTMARYVARLREYEG
jgi:riboflavin synthase